MTGPQLSSRQSSSASHRVIMLLLVGVLLALLAVFCYRAVRQPHLTPGNTEAHPGALLPKP